MMLLCTSVTLAFSTTSSPRLGFAASIRSTPVRMVLSDDDTMAIYAVGFNIGSQLNELSVLDEDSIDTLLLGVKDRLLGNNPNVAGSLAELVPKGGALVQAAAAAKAEVALAAGKELLKAAASEAGAVQTGSGLVYQELVAGSGESPTASTKVKVHYEGKLIDGTVFDSSYARGEPIEFSLGQVIPCVCPSRSADLRVVPSMLPSLILRPHARPIPAAHLALLTQRSLDRHCAPQGVDRGPPTHEGRRQGQAHHTARHCLWRARLAARHPAQCDPQLRGRAAGDARAEPPREASAE